MSFIISLSFFISNQINPHSVQDYVVFDNYAYAIQEIEVDEKPFVCMYDENLNGLCFLNQYK